MPNRDKLAAQNQVMEAMMCSGIHSEMRKRLEGNNGCYIDDSSTPALHHSSKDVVGQTDDGVYIHPYRRELAVQRCFEEVTGIGNAGIVDQQLYFVQFLDAAHY